MATNTSADFDAFDCNLGENGLDEFDPEPPRVGSWLRSGPSAADPSNIDVQDWRLYSAPPRERAWPFAVPVLVAAALVGAAVTWSSIRPSEVATSRRPPAPAPLAAPTVTPAPAPAAAAAPIPAPSETLPAAAAAPTEPAHTALDPGIERTLARVSDAYRALDATALTGVWPGADLPALSESFSGLKYQALTFERCRVQPNGGDGAMATCDVSIANASKAGDAALQRRRESWTMALSRAGDQWTIAGLTVR